MFMSHKKHLHRYSSNELADAIVFPVKLTPSQQKEAVDRLAQIRKREQEEMTEDVRLFLNAFQLKFQEEDFGGSDKDRS
jgi:hypothetical protein